MQETLRALYATAGEDQKELLQKLGFEAPQEPTPDLTELLKKHIAQLPPAVREAVEEPPPEPLSAQEQLTDTSRKYKEATTELRLLITRKSALQLKLDRHKKAYNDMLRDMQALDATLKAKQDTVTNLQAELQSSVAAATVMLRDMQALDATLKAKQDTVTNLQAELQSSVAAATVPGGGPELEAEFFKHLTQLSEDHLQDLKERLFLTIDDGCPAEEGGCQQRTGRGNEDPRYRASCLAPRMPPPNEPIYMISGEVYFLHPTNEWAYSSSSMQVIDNRVDTQIRLRQPLGALREVSYQLFAGDQILASAFEERRDMLCVPRQIAELLKLPLQEGKREDTRSRLARQTTAPPSRAASGIDVCRCRKNGLANARFPLPVFCPLDCIVPAEEGKLADLMWVTCPATTARAFVGRGWYAKPICAYMLEAGLAQWQQFKWSLDATAHVDQQCLEQVLQRMEHNWPEGEEHYAKLAINSLVGLFARNLELVCSMKTSGEGCSWRQTFTDAAERSIGTTSL
eukprot:s604_g1.t3